VLCRMLYILIAVVSMISFILKLFGIELFSKGTSSFLLLVGVILFAILNPTLNEEESKVFLRKREDTESESEQVLVEESQENLDIIVAHETPKEEEKALSYNELRQKKGYLSEDNRFKR